MEFLPSGTGHAMNGSSEPRMNSYSHARSGAGVLRPHSHSSMTRQPSFNNCSRLLASRSTFWWNFCCQNSGRVAGTVEYRHLSWRCQKHPCTKMQTLYLGRTISGEPARCLTCSRYRKPCACSNLRTFISGRVSLPRMRDIMRERNSLLTMSIRNFPVFGSETHIKAS